jgi:hypothetical protein
VGTYLNETTSVISKCRAFKTGRSTTSFEYGAWLSVADKTKGIVCFPLAALSLPLAIIDLLLNIVTLFVVADDAPGSRVKQTTRNWVKRFDGQWWSRDYTAVTEATANSTRQGAPCRENAA